MNKEKKQYVIVEKTDWSIILISLFALAFGLTSCATAFFTLSALTHIVPFVMMFATGYLLIIGGIVGFVSHEPDEVKVYVKG